MNIVFSKVKNLIKNNRNIFVFLVIIMIIGVISGSIFGCIINNDDKKLVFDYINKYLSNITEINFFLQFKNSFIGGIIQISIIWLLGFSIIGLPIIILQYFIYSFSIGLVLISFIINFNFKGIFFSLTYLLCNSLFIIIMLLNSFFAISLAFKIISILFKKKNIDFKIILKKYISILIILIIFNIINAIIDVFIMPFIFNFITRL